MTWARLVWAGLWRRRVRAVLTLLSIVNAFLIFGLLQGLRTGLDNVVRDSDASVLMTFSRVSQTEPLPMALTQSIAAVPGVEAVTPMLIFTGSYRTPTRLVPAVAVDLESYLRVYPQAALAPGAREAMLRTRNGALVSARMARAFGWRVGDDVPIRALLWSNRDTGQTWTVKIVGYMDRAGGREGMTVNYAFVDEGRVQGRDTTNFFLLKVSDPARAATIAANVDAGFRNSAFETRTVTPRQLAQGQIRQVGDIGLVVNAIVGAMFFTLLFSVAAVISQSMRERTAELAVLKTLGFSDDQVMGLLLAETSLYCLLAAGLGLGLAEAMFPLIRRTVGFEASAGPILLSGLGFALILALACGLPPALRARRLQIVDALAGR